LMLASRLCRADSTKQWEQIRVDIYTSNNDKAIETITAMVAKDPNLAGTLLLQYWAQPLFERKHFAELNEILPEAILAAAKSPSELDELQRWYVRSLLAAGKYPDALVAAKSLFNVSRMSDTADAMRLLADVLRKLHSDDPKFVEQFISEQVAGLRATTQPAEPVVPPTLAAIHVDQKVYSAAIKAVRYDGDEYEECVTRGNLFLLADRPKDAMAQFQKAYEIAPDYRLVEATESIARAIKAEDGTIGRANQWILSVRPPTPKN
jgi:tetratricopeptide (TPR) repeat protein